MSRLPIGVRVRNRGLQQPNQPLRQRLDAPPIKQIRTIVEPQLQAARPGTRQQAEGIMRGVMAGDVGEAQAVSLARKAGAVHRIVLKHHQRVEQLAQPGKPWTSASPTCWCAISADWRSCSCAKQRTQLLFRRQPHPQRQRVDEQPHHALDAGKLRRPARNRDAEHHVVAAGQPAEQDRPRRLDVGVERQPAAARLLGQCRSERRAQRQLTRSGTSGARPAHRPPASVGSSSPAKASRQAASAAARSCAAIQRR